MNQRILQLGSTLLLIAAFSFERPPVTSQTVASEVVLRATNATVVAGAWKIAPDSTAAGGQALRHPNASAAKLGAPLATPSNYFELTFEAAAGVPYHLWIRGKADRDSWANDSVYVQFSASVDAAGAAQDRIGSQDAATVTIEDCVGCGLSGWGWQDNGFGAGVLGPHVRFAASGVQTLRIQTREDGLAIDQIVLSPQRYLTTPPGAHKDDDTILSESDDPPPFTVTRGPYLQDPSASAVTVVWATREAGAANVRYVPRGGSGDRYAPASSRLVAAATTGFSFDYYHHEARLTPLDAGTAYNYQLLMDAAPIGAVHSFTTAPPPGTGTVRFIAFGDSGTGSSEQRQLASLMAADTFDLALHAGDIAYGNTGGTGDASWITFQNWFFDVYEPWLPQKPFMPAEGNHDSRSSNGNGRAYLDLFTLPRNGASTGYADHAERYYSFDWGPVHFVALDTEFAFQDTARRDEQLRWLEVDLAATDQPWKIAYYHRSPFSAGGEHGSDLAVRNAFSPVFERYGVQLSLSAHEHDYERTTPQATAGGDRVVYIVTGGGGAPLYAAATASWTAYSASRHHYVRASADGCTLRLEAVGLNGSVFDGTSLSRCTDPPPPPSDDIVLYAADVENRSGAWTLSSDATAAAGVRLRHPNAGAAKQSAPLASPVNFFEIAFTAASGVPYRFWLRGKADSNSWANDSVYVQFSGSVDAGGAPWLRIGTTSAATVTLEDCVGCGVSGWGWQDNGFGTGVLGPLIEFAATGPQTIRIQTREDGFSIDQIVLSPERYRSTAPGALKNDATILSR